MSLAELIALLPVIIAAAVALVVMSAIAVKRRHGLTLILTVGGMGVLLAALPLVAS